MWIILLLARRLSAAVLESRGYSVGIIAQPDWTREESIQVFGEPKLGFLAFRRGIWTLW